MKKNHLLFVLAALTVITVNTVCKKFTTKTVYSHPEIENITNNGVTVITEIREVGGNLSNYGHCYGTKSNPTIDDFKTTNSGVNATTGNFSEDITGLSPNTTYYIRAYAIEDEIRYSSTEQTFTTLNTPTAIISTKASGLISPTGATLYGTVNANGNDAVVTFQYGETTNYGNSVNAVPGSITSNTDTDVSARISELTEGKTYHFRIVATNAGGTVFGDDLTFVAKYTPSPTVETMEASSISALSATLNGSVNAHDNISSAMFEYGLTTDYGNTVEATPISITGNLNENVSAVISDLIENTTYYYRIFATNAGGTEFGDDMTFTATNTAPPTVTTQAASLITQTTATLNGTVNTNGNDATVTFEYGTSTSYGTTLSAGPGTVTSSSNTNVELNLTGLVPNTTYHYRIVAENDGGTSYGDDMSFKATSIPSPTVTSNAESNVGQTTATLNGLVNANGYNSTVTFEYGTTISYGQTITANPGNVTGTSNTSVSANLTGLEPNTTYNFRVKATNDGGTSIGDNISFKTNALEPDVTTQAATTLETTAATLNGLVNAEGASTTVTFEYGLTTSYGTTVNASPNTVTGSSGISVSVDLSSLSPNTTYNFRLIAENNGGISRGENMTFKTDPLPPTVTTQAANSIDQISATLNGLINANETSTTVTFEYGATTSYGTTIDAAPNTVNGTSETSVSVDISSLDSDTEYNFRVVAVNSGGTSYGDNMTFTTDAIPVPSVTTNEASSVEQTTATLNGLVNAYGNSSTVSFEYGTDTNYGTIVTSDQSPVTSSTNTAVSKAISSLTENTTYHYRVFATNAGGRTNGEDKTFTTLIGAPFATTDSTFGVSTTEATFHGTVNANNYNTTVIFEYGETILYGSSIAVNEGTITGNTNESITANLTSLTQNTTYHFRVKAVSSEGTSYGDNMTYTTPAAVTDINGNTYDVVIIGNQVWMKENLKVSKYPNGDAIPFIDNNAIWGDLLDGNTSDAYCVYGDSNNDGTVNVTYPDYGYLYTYSAAIGDNWSRDFTANQGVCPDDWHIPTDAEWRKLIDYLGGTSVAGAKLKENGFSHWQYPNTGASNESGFSALPGGRRVGTNGAFGSSVYQSYLWSATEATGTASWLHILNYNNAEANRGGSSKSSGFSVRCVKD